MPPWRIQVAFQGGGAKLCDLLAAAAAIKYLENQKNIEVTRVAGTSAGAIAACWYATGQEIDLIRQRLRDNGPYFLKKVVPNRTVPGALGRVFFGKPIYDESAFRNVLWEWFKINGQRFETFAQFKIPVLVTATDILNGSKRLFCSAEERVVDALAHSAGLPFAFRTAQSAHTLVDGGICENLPAEELVRDEAQYGKVIGISFSRESVPQMPTNALGYGMALLDAAMGNSMDRACERIGPSAVHRIKTDITTFDFERALNYGLADDHYDRVSNDAKTWILAACQTREAVAEKSVVPPVHQDTSSVELMRKIITIYQLTHHGTRLVIQRSSMVVTAFCLLPSSDVRSGLPDSLKQEIRLSPVDSPVGCFRVGMFSDPVEGDVTHTLRTAQKKPIEMTLIPVTVPHRQLLFFFHPALDPMDKAAHPYVLTIQNQVPKTLCDIAIGEHISLTSDRAENIEIVDIVMFLPDPYKRVVLSDFEGYGDSNTVPGRKMSDEELSDYGDPLPGFAVVGWRGCNLKVGQIFGVHLRLPRERTLNAREGAPIC